MMQKKSFLAWFFIEVAEHLTLRLATAPQNTVFHVNSSNARSVEQKKTVKLVRAKSS
jgi:hypothetical protein